MAISIPGYKVIRSLGQGGMAVVYLAEQEVFGRQVALKVLRRSVSQDQKFGQRFLQEAKIVSQLVHPNIVTVYDAGVYEDYYYLSMEYVRGRDLRAASGDLSIPNKLKAVRDIAKALRYSGEKGFVHRDIKPENIIVCDNDGRAVLMDFGIARAIESDASLTQTGIAIGTPYYMSPEQAKGKAVDVRSDIYSLGVVLFFLLCHRVPYEGESAVEIGIKHISEPVPTLHPSYSIVEPVIGKMMAKDVRDRYQTGEELLAALDRIDFAKVDAMITGSQYNPVITGSHTVSQAIENSSTLLEAVENSEYDSFTSTVAFEYDEGSDRAPFPFWTLLFIVSALCGIAVSLFFFLRPDDASRLLELITLKIDQGIDHLRSWWQNR